MFTIDNFIIGLQNSFRNIGEKEVPVLIELALFLHPSV
jgi:hypothetical protein